MSEKEITVYSENFKFYKKYHNNILNVLVHILCIPVLVWSTFGITNTLGRYAGLDQESYMRFLPSTLLYSMYMIYYKIIAPKKVFWQTFYLYLILLININTNYSKTYSGFVYYITHILGWILQIGSHKIFEGNSPALLQGIVQSFITAPIFIVHELVDNIEGFGLRYVALMYSLYKLIF